LRPLATNLGGDERSLARGHGMELVELRPYQPGDDIRHIDWNVTARSDQPFVRDSQVERGLDVWLLVDISGSIDWGTALCSKRARTAEFAAAAGQMLGRHGNRVGGITFAERPGRIVPPAAGRAQLLRVLASIHEAPRQSARGRTDLAGAIAYAGSIIRRRSLVLVVSDFLVPDGWQPALGTLARRHEVVAVRLHDPREAELPDVGIVTLEDPETGGQLIVNTGDAGLRQRFQVAARQQAERIRADINQCGVDQLMLRTDEELVPTLVRFLHARRLRRSARIDQASHPNRPPGQPAHPGYVGEGASP
jgi:uncharacterized protein (DUF58 family)